MKPVAKSSTIDSVGYDPAHQRLKVRFKSGGTYQFEGVSPEDHAKLITAESVGKHFHKHIKGSFKSTKLEEEHR